MYSKGKGISPLAVQQAQEQSIGCDMQDGLTVQRPLLKATHIQKQAQNEVLMTAIGIGN